MKRPHVAAIILAAGESRRFGCPKQLAQIAGQTLIQRAVDAALGSLCDQVVVVLGANADAISREIKGPIQIVENTEWRRGMGTSLSRGVTALPSTTESALVMLGDQPRITWAILNMFVEAADRRLVAAEYGGEIGVPALFGREFFPELQALNGQSGAKEILRKNQHLVFRVDCPEAETDIDTPADLQSIAS